MTEPEPDEPEVAPLRPAQMVCPGCQRAVQTRPSGHVNPHWVDDAYTCQGEAF